MKWAYPKCVAPSRSNCQIVEKRVHAGEEDGRDQAEPECDRGAWLDQGSNHPDGQVREDDTCYLPEAASAVDLKVRGEVLLPALAGWDACGVHGGSSP